MIQDIAPRRFCNDFLRLAPEGGDLVLDFSAEGLLLANGRPPAVEAWRKSPAAENAALLYAFRLTGEAGSAGAPLPAFEATVTARDAEKSVASLPESAEERFFLALRAGDAEAPAPEPWQRTAPRALRTAPSPLPLVAATGLHLHHWYDTHRFCPRCAAPLKHADKERALACPACGHIVYPAIAPCVIVAVTHEDRLLLTRYARPGATHFVLVAGFVEIGETAEQAAAREVMEETGLRIRNLRYAGSQPWGLSGTLAVGFVAELDGPDAIRLDTSELAEARWVSRADIPPCPFSDSLTMNMIARFAKGEL